MPTCAKRKLASHFGAFESPFSAPHDDPVDVGALDGLVLAFRSTHMIDARMAYGVIGGIPIPLECKDKRSVQRRCGLTRHRIARQLTI